MTEHCHTTASPNGFRDTAGGDTKPDAWATMTAVPAELADAVVVEHGGDLLERTTAVFDHSRRYRYLLTRVWSTAAAPLVVCMVNPSTADAHKVDPTIDRCVRRARRAQAGGLVVVNLFGLRATNPATLRTAADPVGPHTDRMLEHVLHRANDVVVAWGVHGQLADRGRRVVDQLHAGRVRIWCLGTTKDGHPRHPLYVSVGTQLQPYPPPA